jgi:hypothetical protein
VISSGEEIGTERRRPKWLEILLGPGRMAAEYVHVSSRKVELVMTRDPATVAEEDSLSTVVELMECRRIKRLPVLRDGKIVGIVSRANLMHALVSFARDTVAPAGGDSVIRDCVLAAVAKQPWAPQVNVVVKNGVVELWGTITDERERQGCIVTAENVAGVLEVHDHLVWVEPMSGMAFLRPRTRPRCGRSHRGTPFTSDRCETKILEKDHLAERDNHASDKIAVQTKPLPRCSRLDRRRFRLATTDRKERRSTFAGSTTRSRFRARPLREVPFGRSRWAESARSRAPVPQAA